MKPIRATSLLFLAASTTSAQDNGGGVSIVSVDPVGTGSSANDVFLNNANGPSAFSSSPARPYTEAQCDAWLDGLFNEDGDGSSGLSEEEFYAFLSGLSSPPYVQEYFTQHASFGELPWLFKVVHKSLACRCEDLGLGRVLQGRPRRELVLGAAECGGAGERRPGGRVQDPLLSSAGLRVREDHRHAGPDN